jgi:hypothetical protein
MGIIYSFKAKRLELFTVYTIKKGDVYSLKNRNTTLINRRDSSDYNYHIQPHLISFNNPQIKVEPYNFVRKGATQILVLDQPGKWPVAIYRNISTLVIGNNFKLTEADLQKFTHLQLIVSAASNNSYTNKKTQELSRKFDLDFYDIRQKGACLFALE